MTDAPFDLAVVGGTLVTGDDAVSGHLYVRDGRVARIDEAVLPAGRVVDATGLWVMPGFVDTHVHLMDPGETEREDFPHGTAAAAARGVTTIVEHTHSQPVRSPGDLREKVAYLRGRSHVDHGLAAHVWPEDVGSLSETWAAGVAFFKVFTCETHGVPAVAGETLRTVLRVLAAAGAPCLIHAEDDVRTREAAARLRAEGRTDGGVIPEWRSREAELAAVEEICRAVTETSARVTVAHVSSPQVASVVAEARARGAHVNAESCPQYFVLREDEVRQEGALRKFTPPARAQTDADERAMWALLSAGTLTHVSTDHAPSTKAQKAAGDIWSAPFGLPGLDTTTRVLLDAVSRGLLSPSDVALRYSEMPARIMGSFPRKGSISVGADADVALIDPGASVTIRDEDILSKAAWSPYSGRTLRGDVVRVFLRGIEIARGGKPLDRFEGRFVPGKALTSA
jgi:dihydroorotase (multifunctional complex type)